MGTLLNVLKHVMAKRDHRAGALKLAAPVAVILTCLLCALWQPEGVDAIVAERSTSSKWIDSDSVKEKLAQIQTDTMDEVEHPTEPRLSIRAAENELDEDTRILKKAVGASSTHKKINEYRQPVHNHGEHKQKAVSGLGRKQAEKRASAVRQTEAQVQEGCKSKDGSKEKASKSQEGEAKAQKGHEEEESCCSHQEVAEEEEQEEEEEGQTEEAHHQERAW